MDAVLVLGKQLLGQPDRALAELRARSAAAAAAWRNGVPRVLALEAPLRGQARAGSAIVAELLDELGLPASALLRREATRSTREEVLLCHHLARVHGWRRVLVLTHAYHLPRTRRYLDEVMGPSAATAHVPSALLRLASPRERAWIRAAVPSPATLREEARVEALWTALGHAVGPLPARWRWELEVAAGRALRGAADVVAAPRGPGPTSPAGAVLPGGRG